MESNLKNRFDDFGAAPTNELWDRIENTLDEKPRRKPLFWWVYYGIAAIFIVLLVLTRFQNLEFAKNQKGTNFSEENIQNEVESLGKQNMAVHQKPATIANEHNKDSVERKQEKTPDFYIALSQGNYNKAKKTPVPPVQDIETTELIEFVSNEREENVSNKEIENPQIDLTIKTDETLIEQEKDSSNLSIINDSTSLDPVPPVKHPAIKEQTFNRRFEIGLSYSWLTGQRKSISNSELTTYMIVPDNTDPTVPGANVKFYTVTAPVNLHVNYGYYFNSKWRIDSELGYSKFVVNQLDKNKNKMAYFTEIRSISMPVFISYISILKKTQHTLNYGVGVGNDLSFANWNASNRFYYGLSAQLRIGYGYYFGTSHNWKASVNFVMRQTVYEAAAKKSSFNNRLLYGGQVGVSRCF